MAEFFVKTPRFAAAAAVVFALGAPVLAARAEAPAAAVEPERIAESYKLPITPPLDQGETGLCWVYATLSMLETNYLAKHPESQISLSRGALQRFAIADRFQRFITGNSTYLEDGGLSVDALMLIRQNGLIEAPEHKDVVESEPVFETISERLAQVPGSDAKLKALDEALARELGPAPRETRLDGKAMTPAQLAKAVLGDEIWSEYDIAPPGPPHTGKSSDPDARPETMVHRTDLNTAVELIHASLKRGESVVWGSTENHALLIYGGDYDEKGHALAYWIKDSFAPYTYRAAAEDIHKILTDVTVSEPTLAAAKVAEKN